MCNGDDPLCFSGVRAIGGPAAGTTIATGLQQVLGASVGTAAACILTGYCSQESDDTSGSGTQCPDLPDVLVGDQSHPNAGPNKKGKKHTSGPLLPEFGGTGDYETDLQILTGGTRPAIDTDSAELGSQIGNNGIFGRRKNKSGGASIDIPAKGDRPHETLHY